MVNTNLRILLIFQLTIRTIFVSHLPVSYLHKKPENPNSGLKVFLLFIFLCLGTDFVYSQTGLNPKKILSQYILQSWNSEQGLGSESTNDLIQTADGYIWIATYTGLYRFDGKDFTVFNAQNSTIPSSNVLRLGYDSNNTLWVGTLHGLAKYENGTFERPEALSSSSNYIVESMEIMTDNSIWFATKSNNLFRYANDQLEDFTSDFSDRKSTIITIAEKNGEVYFGTDDSKLIRYTNSKGFQELVDDRSLNGINQIFVCDHTIYLGTGNGLFTLLSDELEKVKVLQNSVITSIAEDTKKSLWLGTMKGLYRYQKDTDFVDFIDESKGLPNNIIRDLLIDNEENLWGGTYRNGLFMLSDGSLTTYSNSNGLSSDIISGVTQLSSNEFLLGNENGELDLIKDGKISEVNSTLKLPAARLKHLMTDSSGRVWASTYGGLYVLGKKKHRKYNILNGFPDNFIRLSYQDSQNNIWIGTKNAGLIRFKNLDEWEVLDLSNGLTSNYVMSITENPKGQLIVGTMHGINIIEDMKVKETITTDNGLPSNFSFSIYAQNEYLWIASNDGLIRHHPDHIISFDMSNGMPSEIIYDVLPDENGNLWLPSEKSIIKVNIAQLNEVRKNPSLRVFSEEFNQSDGMKNNHCLGAALSLRDSSGNFWIPTLGGIVLVEPNKVKYERTSITPIIEKILADNRPILINESKITIPASTDRVQIKYTGIKFRNTQKMSFRYRLKPFDETWIESEGARNALYTNIPPGEYEFEIQSGLNQQFEGSIARTSIYFEASWWQTIWAKLLAGLLMLFFVLFIYLYRVKALKTQNLKLELMVDRRTNQLVIQKQELAQALKELSEAQEKMLQSEKMASLGVLSAGVAHEINNPLNIN